MAINHLQLPRGISTNSVDHNFSLPLRDGSNRALIVVITWEDVPSFGETSYGINSVKFGGVNLTKQVGGYTTTGGADAGAEIWYLKEANFPASGFRKIEVDGSFSGVGVLYAVSYAIVYSGVDQDTFIEASNVKTENTPADDTIENAISPTQGSWVVSNYVSGQPGTAWSVGQGQVELVDFSDAQTRHGVSELRGADGETSLSSTFSTTANRMVRCAVSLKAYEQESVMVI